MGSTTEDVGFDKSLEAAVLDGLVATYPGLREQLLTPDGGLNRFVNVYLNDEDIRYLAELKTPTGERDTIVILPAMAGGAA